MKVFSVHAGSVWQYACDARDRAKEAVTRVPGARPPDAIMALILSAVAAEGFINEIMESAAGIPTGADQDPAFRAFIGAANVVREIEDSRGTAGLKYQMAYRMLTGQPLDIGANPYQDFALLLKLRNMIMHLKSHDQGVMTDGLLRLGKLPKDVETLRNRGLVDFDGVSPWFQVLHSDRLAEWACAASRAIIVALLDQMPEGPRSLASTMFSL